MKFLAIVAVVALGMYGLHLHIEYSGWVLLVGLVACVCVF